MGVFTYDYEIASSIPPCRLFKSFVLDGDNLIPKIAPQAIKSVEILEGDGGVGTVKKVNFGEGTDHKCMKQKINGIDKDNFVYKYSIIEGDAIGDKIEKIDYELKLVASSGGCIVKSTSHYHCKGEADLKEDQIKAGKDRASSIFKMVESYLAAHPEEYK